MSWFMSFAVPVVKTPLLLPPGRLWVWLSLLSALRFRPLYSAPALALETPPFLFRAAILFRRCGPSCAFNFARKDNLVQDRFCSHTVLLMNISRLELTNLWNACYTLLCPNFWKGSLFMLLWSWRLCSFCGMTYQVTYDVSMTGWANSIDIPTFCLRRYGRAAGSSSVDYWSRFHAVPALTGETVGIVFLTHWRYYDFWEVRSLHEETCYDNPRYSCATWTILFTFPPGCHIIPSTLEGNLFCRLCTGAILCVLSSE
jgi:hypothetical protein